MRARRINEILTSSFMENSPPVQGMDLRVSSSLQGINSLGGNLILDPVSGLSNLRFLTTSHKGSLTVSRVLPVVLKHDMLALSDAASVT